MKTYIAPVKYYIGVRFRSPIYTVCPRSCKPFYIEIYCINWDQAQFVLIDQIPEKKERNREGKREREGERKKHRERGA